ncbi:AAA family ATPase [Pseudoduganella aquatica]|uniref:AAA family ATPase n=1 Tax=Pseudoduganella aquatica TaxID=2660641 RepID=A0A7X4HBB2_9BURK|nr:AAA family ATPase [Pseudoduganella aquatica]MYN08103.1 AAA family ATPase [Pseudoduganella aquatica]
MYTQFFNLKQSPFSIAPDPRYLYMSERHREALAHLLYGVGSGGGFVLLTGEIGAGKTTVCRCFMEQIPENCQLGYIFNPKLTVEELLLSVCDEFRITLPPQGAGAVSVKGYVDAINQHLLASHAQGRNNVLIIDEAQNLSADVLEQLRLLTNLETSERKLLQIILIGQPELRSMLARPELEQLAQRVIARYHLGSLSVEETGSYIGHRLAVAGAVGVAPFPGGLMQQIHQLTKGVPRRINLLCDRAMLGAYVENAQQVTRKILRRAAAEVFATETGAATVARPWLPIAAGVLAGAVLTAIAAWQLMPHSVPMAGPGTANVAGSGAAKMPQSGAVVNGGAAAPGSGVANLAGSGTVAATSDVALRQMAALWGQTVPSGEFCPAAAKQNLRCLFGKGGLDDVRLLDRPVVLKLIDDPTTPRFAMLTAMDGQGATLDIAGKRETVRLDALASRFDGSFITLWRAPRGWRDEVSAGDHGPDVDWLAKRLASLHGGKPPQENRPMDAETQRLLREFQLSQNLKADGVAGPKTFIRLNQLGGVNEPRLLAPAKPGVAVAGK